MGQALSFCPPNDGGNDLDSGLNGAAACRRDLFVTTAVADSDRPEEKKVEAEEEDAEDEDDAVVERGVDEQAMIVEAHRGEAGQVTDSAADDDDEETATHRDEEEGKAADGLLLLAHGTDENGIVTEDVLLSASDHDDDADLADAPLPDDKKGVDGNDLLLDLCCSEKLPDITDATSSHSQKTDPSSSWDSSEDGQDVREIAVEELTSPSSRDDQQQLQSGFMVETGSVTPANTPVEIGKRAKGRPKMLSPGVYRFKLAVTSPFGAVTSPFGRKKTKQ